MEKISGPSNSSSHSLTTPFSLLINHYRPHKAGETPPSPFSISCRARLCQPLISHKSTPLSLTREMHSREAQNSSFTTSS